MNTTLSELNLVGTIVDNHLYTITDQGDERITSFNYGQSFIVVIGGKSSIYNSLHYECKSLTGEAIIDSYGQFTFVSPGKVIVYVYEYVPGTDPVEIVSKTLGVEVELYQDKVTLSVYDIVLDIGEPVPTIDSDEDGTPGWELSPSGTLSRNPDIFFVCESDDFYRLDILQYANSEDRYSNGVKYRKNADGSWTMSGHLEDLSSPSEYSLILSKDEIPSYMNINHTFQIVIDGQYVPVVVSWFDKYGNIILSSTNASTRIIDKPDGSASSGYHTLDEVAGITISFIIRPSLSWATTEFTRTAKYKIVDLDDRNIDNISDGTRFYYIGARNAEVDPSIQNYYDSNINYRSGVLIYQNTKDYNIYTTYDRQQGSVSVSSTKAKPYQEVTFTVKSNVGITFDDGYVSSLSQTLFVQGSDGEYLSFQRVGEPTYYEGSGGSTLFSCTYETTMPIGSIVIICEFSPIGTSGGSGELDIRTYPYKDIDIYNPSEVTDANDEYIQIIDGDYESAETYKNAIKFCKWARQIYFQEAQGTPLIEGDGAVLFYPDYDQSNHIIIYATRGQIQDTLKRVSHSRSIGNLDAYQTSGRVYHRGDYCWYPTVSSLANMFRCVVDSTSGAWDSSAWVKDNIYPHETSGNSVTWPYGIEYNVSNVSQYPDKWLQGSSALTNSPETHMFTYAGYPPAEGQPVLYTNLENVFSYNCLYEVKMPRSHGSSYTPPGTTDDFNNNVFLFDSLSWNAWIGVIEGMSEFSYAPGTYTTFEEVCTMMWRYAKFRQFDIMGDGIYKTVDDSSASYWAQNGPIKWAVSRGISTGYHMPYKYYRKNGSSWTLVSTADEVKIHPSDKLNRAEYAYMLTKFCQMYAW